MIRLLNGFFRFSFSPRLFGWRGLTYGAIALSVFLGVYFLHPQVNPHQNSLTIQWATPSFAQRQTPETIAAQIYEQMPAIPQNNQYISRNTGEVAAQNTLISRLIRYHEFVRSRPTIFRFDWKLTLADYLGYNEMMREESYPGFSTLTQNPFSEDRESIQSLTREQRNQLVDILVSIYQPPTPETPESINPSEVNSEQNNSNPPPILPRRGGADLLMP